MISISYQIMVFLDLMICLMVFLQDRIVKVVYLVSSIVVNISRPIVIISPCAFLSFWEAEFSRLAASINVVVYDGNRDARNIIRSVEFYEGGNIMVQVLLCSTEAVSEVCSSICFGVLVSRKTRTDQGLSCF